MCVCVWCVHVYPRQGLRAAPDADGDSHPGRSPSLLTLFMLCARVFAPCALAIHFHADHRFFLYVLSFVCLSECMLREYQQIQEYMSYSLLLSPLDVLHTRSCSLRLIALAPLEEHVRCKHTYLGREFAGPLAKSMLDSVLWVVGGCPQCLAVGCGGCLGFECVAVAVGPLA